MSDAVTKARKKQYGEYLIGQKPEYTKMEFVYVEESQMLFADLSVSEEEILFNRSLILDILKENNYQDFFFFPNALDKLFNQANNNERGRFPIGQKKDAKIDIEFDDEFMTAFISVSPPHGGRDLDEHLLNVALADAMIDKNCCDKNIIKNRFAREKCHKARICTWQ